MKEYREFLLFSQNGNRENNKLKRNFILIININIHLITIHQIRHSKYL